MKDINKKLKDKSLTNTAKKAEEEKILSSSRRGSFQVTTGENPLFQNTLSPIMGSCRVS